jgi:hypothetical protein
MPKKNQAEKSEPFNWLALVGLGCLLFLLILLMVMVSKPELLGGQRYIDPLPSFDSDILALFPIFLSLPSYWQIIIWVLFLASGFLIATLYENVNGEKP